MIYGSLCYLPSRSVINQHPDSFLANLKNFPAKHPVHLYSYAYKDTPGVIPLLVDVMESDKISRTMRVNLIFWTGVRIAASMGLTHFLCMETDCRVSVDHWDDILLQEFLSKNPHAVMGGDLRVFNPQSHSMDVAMRTEKLIVENYGKRPWPILIAGGGSIGQRLDSCVFANGAFCIYQVAWLIKTYPALVSSDPNAIVEFCKNGQVWDYQIGIDLFRQYGPASFDRVVQLNSAYSGYGDILTDEAIRRKWLEDRTVVGVHQIKSNWDGPVNDGRMFKPYDSFKHGAVEVTLDTEAPLASSKITPEMLIKALPPNESEIAKEFRKAGEFLMAIQKEPPLNPETILGPVTWTADMVKPSTAVQIKEYRFGLLWVTHGKDLEWFTYSAKSYSKFAKGWHKAVCVVPLEDGDKFRPICEANGIICVAEEQWPDKPFNWHQFRKCCADLILMDCDVHFHIDADCVFAQPCTPSDWMVGDKILMLYTPYEAFLTRPVTEDEQATFMGFTGKKIDFNRGQYNWKFAVEFALGFTVERECMAWAPLAHWKETYKKTRDVIQQRNPQSGFDGYVRSCRDTHPQSFCEHNTLGAIDHKFFEDRYHWINIHEKGHPFLGKVIQSWSHGGLDREHDYGAQAADKSINTPRKLLENLGLIGKKRGPKPKEKVTT